jgi:hypothetical protein
MSDSDRFAVVRQNSSLVGFAQISGWFSNARAAELAFAREQEWHPDCLVSLVKLVKQAKPKRVRGGGPFGGPPPSRRPTETAPLAAIAKRDQMRLAQDACRTIQYGSHIDSLPTHAPLATNRRPLAL